MKFNDQFKKLDDIGSVGRGKSKHRPRNDASLYGGIYPFIQTGDVRKAEYYLSAFKQTYNEKGLAQSKLWDEGTLCITIAANIAETAVLGIKACFPDSIIGFIPYENKADVRFVKYCLETYKLQMQALSKGATQDNLSLEKLRSLNFLIPKIDEQRKIANILYSYDKLIQNNTKRISILEQMAEQLYKEWFVRMRFPNYENNKFIKGIPEGWQIEAVKSFGKVVTGKTPSTTIQDYYNGDYPFIKTPDMHNFMFALETGETLSQRGFNSQPSQKLPSGSICVSCIGSAGVVCITNEVSMSNQQIHSLIPKKKEQLEFLYYTLLKLKPTIELFGATGATMTNLSKGKFEKLLILKPTDVLIENYHDATKSIFEEIKNLSLQNINLKKTRDLLLPRLISGKLKLNKKL
jgi:type I restriction enzyme S subunit